MCDTALHNTVRDLFQGNANDGLTKIKQLVDQGAQIDCHNEYGETPYGLLVNHFNALLSEAEDQANEPDLAEIRYKINYLNRINEVFNFRIM